MTDRFHFSPRPNKAHEINWREWGEDAFKEAKDNNKLILLSISAVWCHWCHVMDETAYSYQDNIDLINAEFIPIRVDNDQNPDVNRIYNMGGWPTTAILTPDGKTINGATYLTENKLYTFLLNTHLFYKQKDKEYFKEPSKGEINIPQASKDIDLNHDILKDIDKTILSIYDPEYGGFGIQPKFLYTDVLDYLIFRFFNKKDNSMFRILTNTLRNMAEGGIYDKEEGGFFRYSTTRDWRIPHFEKMLEDNGGLLDIYLKAYQITNDTSFADTARGIINYLDNTLLNKSNSTFFGSQDADEHYYSLKVSERKSLDTPYIDKTIYTDWNSIAASAYIRASYTLDMPNCLEIAKKCMDFLIDNCFSINQGMHHYYTDSPHKLGILSDQVYTINALIDLYEATFDKKYIDRAYDLGEVVLDRFFDQAQGGFYDDIVSYEFAPNIPKMQKSISLTSFTAQVLFRLHDITSNNEFKDAAVKGIKYFYNSYKLEDIFAANYGKAVLGYFLEGIKISIVGDLKNQETAYMYNKALKKFIPFKIFEFFDVNTKYKEIEQLGYDASKHPAGYICKGESCQSPVFSGAEFESTINSITQ